MSPEAYVLDASVAAKWFLNDEDLAEKSRSFLDAMMGGQIEFHAPIMLKFEMADILTRARRDKKRSHNIPDCLHAFSFFSRLPIIFHETKDQEILEAIDFANKFHRRVYDSLYLCLARSLGIRWLTSERRFSKLLHPEFPSGIVLTLESAENI